MTIKSDYGAPYSNIVDGGYVCMISTANAQVGATANTAISYTAPTVAANMCWSPGLVFVGYDTDPAAAGAVTVTDSGGSNTYFRLDLTKGGAAFFDLSRVRLPKGTTGKVTCGAASGAKGRLTVVDFIEPI